MKTTYKQINELLKFLDDRNEAIKQSEEDKRNNRLYSDAMRNLGVTLFFIPSYNNSGEVTA